MTSDMARDIQNQQREVCERFGAPFLAAPPELKLGVSRNVRTGAMPVHGLRHPPEQGTSGWFIWADEELSDAPDFFEPLHISHIAEYCPQVLVYLGLGPGWRFLLADDYEDVWEDTSLLTVE